MDVVKFLHASDLHIAKQPNSTSLLEDPSFRNMWRAVSERQAAPSYDDGALRALVELASDLSEAQEEPIKALIISGDLATTGIEPDLRAAKSLLKSQPGIFSPILNKIGFPTLAGLKIPVWVLPGNHDRYELGHPLFYKQGGILFDKIFSEDWNERAKKYSPILQGNGFSVGVLGADFSLMTPTDEDLKFIGRLSQGKVEQWILDKLVQITDEQKQSVPKNEVFIPVWVLHFPPNFPHHNRRTSRWMKLIDEKLLIASANEIGVSAILAGHTHRPICYKHPEMKFETLCAGTASEYGAKGGNHCQVISFSLDRKGAPHIEHEHYFFDKYESEFRKV